MDTESENFDLESIAALQKFRQTDLGKAIFHAVIHRKFPTNTAAFRAAREDTLIYAIEELFSCGFNMGKCAAEAEFDYQIDTNAQLRERLQFEVKENRRLKRENDALRGELDRLNDRPKPLLELWKLDELGAPDFVVSRIQYKDFMRDHRGWLMRGLASFKAHLT